jgi:uncharacterized membrane protein
MAGKSVLAGQVRPSHGHVLKQGEGRKTLMLACITGTTGVLLPWLFWLFGGDAYVTSAFSTPLSQTNPALITMEVLFLGFMPVMIWHSVIVKGWARTIAATTVVYLIAGTFEALGTNFGWIYGPYHYSDIWLFHVIGVPVIVPIAWETILYPSFYLSLYLIPTEVMNNPKTLTQKITSTALLALLGACILTAIDLVLDPVCCGIGSWNWHVNGEFIAWMYGGEPIHNFFGWMITGFPVMLAYRFILGTTATDRHVRSRVLDIYIPIAVYGFYFIALMEIEFIMQRHLDVVLVGGLSFGSLLIAFVTKLCYEKMGSYPNPIGTGIAEEVIAKEKILVMQEK